MQRSYANYDVITALAPTPIPIVAARSLSGIDPIRVTTALVPTDGSVTSDRLIIRVTNPFVPAGPCFQTL